MDKAAKNIPGRGVGESSVWLKCRAGVFKYYVRQNCLEISWKCSFLHPLPGILTLFGAKFAFITGTWYRWSLDCTLGSTCTELWLKWKEIRIVWPEGSNYEGSVCALIKNWTFFYPGGGAGKGSLKYGNNITSFYFFRKITLLWRVAWRGSNPKNVKTYWNLLFMYR